MHDLCSILSQFINQKNITIGFCNRQEKFSRQGKKKGELSRQMKTKKLAYNSAAPGMHFQMWVLAQSININKLTTSRAGFKLFAFFRSTIATRLPD